MNLCLAELLPEPNRSQASTWACWAREKSGSGLPGSSGWSRSAFRWRHRSADSGGTTPRRRRPARSSWWKNFPPEYFGGNFESSSAPIWAAEGRGWPRWSRTNLRPWWRSYRTVSCRITPYHVVSCRIVSYRQNWQRKKKFLTLFQDRHEVDAGHD